MAKKLTPHEKKAYLKNKGSHCPVCSSKNIEGNGTNDTDGDVHSREIECNSCGAIWDDIYTLTNVELKDV